MPRELPNRAVDKLLLLHPFHEGQSNAHKSTFLLKPKQSQLDLNLENMSTGKTGWKDSYVDSTMGEMAAYIHGNQGVLAERLAEHETLL